MNVPELEHLVELVQRANISELTLRQAGARVTIRKTPRGVTTGSELVAYAPAGQEGYDDDGQQTPFTDGEAAPTEPEPIVIFSPLVGHFRHIKPLVGLGARVAKGQVVGVIEAVKLINEITCPTNGRVMDVLVEDGQAVEYGQELFSIQPDL